MDFENEKYTQFRLDAHKFLDKEIDKFIEYQDISLKTLHQIHKVCEKNGIKYYLAYGSLLGAIRDGGMIPWDYDIDIWVEGDKISHLIDALKKDLNKEYYFVCRYYDKSHRHYYMRVAPKGISTEILHVDIFWLWKGGNDAQHLEKANRILKKQKILSDWRNCDLKYITAGLTRGIKKICRVKSLLAHIFLPNFVLDYMNRSQIRRFGKDGIYMTDEYSIFRKEWFDARRKIRLNDGNEYYIPEGYDEILKKEYGDYRNYLPIKSRVEELRNSLCRISEGLLSK